jgi:hypothetical protein
MHDYVCENRIEIMGARGWGAGVYLLNHYQHPYTHPSQETTTSNEMKFGKYVDA